MTDDDKKGGMPNFVTFTQIADLVNELELVSRPITRPGVRYIADHDPDWPVPRDQWMKIGSAWAMPWAPIEKFFRERTAPRGRGPAPKADDAPTSETEPEQ